MRINNNMLAQNTHRQMGVTGGNQAKSMEKLSSGLRINKAGDDAAGLAISEKMRGQIRGLNMASKNSQDGISMIQTAEGALSETHEILQRMRELAVQSSNDTNVGVDRGEIQKEMDELAKEVTRISNNTEFNTQKLINGGIKDDGIKTSKFHVGANANQDITLSINAMDAKSLGVSRDIDKASKDVVAGDVSDVKFASKVGAGIEDGATVTLTHTAEVVAEAATSGTSKGDSSSVASVGALNTLLGDSSSTNKSITLTIDGTDKTITFDKDYSGAGAYADLAAVKADIDSKLGGAATVEIDGSQLKFTSTSTGTNSKVAVKTDISKIVQDTATTDTVGAASIKGESAKITLTSDGAGAKTQTINVTGDEKSLKIKEGFFEGTEISLKGKASAIAGGDDTFKIKVDTEVAKKTGFSGGAKTEDAVAEAGIDVSTQASASSAVTTIQDAIETVSAERSKLGSYTNRLEHTIKNLDTSAENLQAAESRIRDVDMAKEMMSLSKNNILQQAAQAMMAQANQQPQGVLQLLR